MKPVDPRLLRYATAARGYLALAVVLGLAGTALILAQAGLLAHALASAATGTGATALEGTLIALLVVLAARAAAAYGGEAAALHASATVKSQLRQRLTRHVLRLGPSWLAGQKDGEITALTLRGLDALDPYFARYLSQLILACLVPVAVLIRVALADWISALVILATLPLIPVFAILVGLHTKAQTRRQWLALGRLGGHFLDVVEGLTTLKIFGRASAQAVVISEVTGAHRRATMRTLRVAFLSAFVLELAATLATALVAVEVGLRLFAGHLDYQTALLVLLLTPEAYLPLRNVGVQFHASAEGAAAAEQAFTILGTPAHRDPAARPAASQPDLRCDHLTLHDVRLDYPGRDHPALEDVSLTIRPGEHLTITGPSGAGKSSLLALLLRFCLPASGVIHVGRTDLASIPPQFWQRQIAWVPQHPHLFDATVAENIALGRPGASRQEIVRAARSSGADGFIDALPDGYDTPLGERGLRLSAGQRQKIAIARAFLQDAPLLLLDEPAAHLDPLSAGQVYGAIDRLMTGRTVIHVTHRPPARPRAGRVLTLDHGRLAQQISPTRLRRRRTPARSRR